MPAPSAHPGRSAPSQQPAPVYVAKGTANTKWYVQALVSRMGTGKAAGTQIDEKSPKMFAATEEEALLKQQRFINDYIHPQKRQKKAAGSAVPAAAVGEAGCSGAASAMEQAEPRPKRAVAPSCLAAGHIVSSAPNMPVHGPGAHRRLPELRTLFSGALVGSFSVGFSRARACWARCERACQSKPRPI